ncbi:hypothetical protein sos41_12610 [Alphaproteobacteria bacterium SO-S41]|nr:hypothetical protein sos41_12610 [Alphaproteobacteria bacterium SO-S41]
MKIDHHNVAWSAATPASERDVRAAFTQLLKREPESAEIVQNWLGRKWSLGDLARYVRGSAEFADRSAKALMPLLLKTDRYQAIYGLPHLSLKDARDCVDRCVAVTEAFERLFGLTNLAHLKVADIGCSLGYPSLYLADRGADVTGYDFRKENVDFCRGAAEILDIPAKFNLAVFDWPLARQLVADGTNVVLLWSVLHHVIEQLGFVETKKIVAYLLASGVTLVCELAHANEDVTHKWRETLPANELDLFDSKSVQVSNIGNFVALSGISQRNMYVAQMAGVTLSPLASERQPERSGGAAPVRIGPLTFSGISHVGVPFKQYASTEDLFVKFFRYGAANRFDVLRRMEAEFFANKLLASTGLLPKLQSVSRAPNFVGLAFDKVKGAQGLIEWSRKADMVQRRSMAIKIAEGYATIAKQSLYWNDCRDHNILVGKDGRVIFIDFELASPLESEDNARRARWLLWHLCTNAKWDSSYVSHLPTSELPDLPKFAPNDLRATWVRIERLIPTGAA